MVATIASDPERYVKDFETAWNRKDAKSNIEYYAEKGEFWDPMAAEPSRDRQGLMDASSKWFEAFSEMKIRLLSSAVQGRNVALLYECTGRNTGELEIAPGETIPATNRSATVQVAEFDEIDAQGKIVRSRVLFDSGKFMQQLGLMPQPGAQPSAAGRAPRSATR